MINTFTDLLNDTVCGFCNERERPSTVQRQHAVWLDMTLGGYIKCPECDNVYKPTEWDPESEAAQYVYTKNNSIETNFGKSILESARETLEEAQ